LFALAIDPLQRLFDRAIQLSMLQPNQHKSVKLRGSKYANDATFFNPLTQEISAALEILSTFGHASLGLVTNL
jgi:hypothetical protein